MLVYICCAGGATSSLFCQKIGQASSQKVLVEDIFSVLKNLDTLMDSYDMILAYGPVEFLNKRTVQEWQLDKKIASIWIAPQVRYLKEMVDKVFNNYHIPVHLIDMRAFGTMNGQKALDDILNNL
ncbi:MAG: PTS beta-glucoside transporter subunit IIB [Longibaculum muris]|uniref:Cellobiose-specific phosphotransferase system component IIB n=1 Tax=Longibaculum muris TaxID=1796628 RepID=A0A4R3Z6J1_9FIRM|nr:PTS beta-glucoside transporter subunit IIB [Longibaculum muris]KXU46357.1 hypothetical protein HMPREF3037_02143 [Candidatus Stoquefichus sp. KLE1796]MBS5371255.1 PTS beta-glucoside transporter subunit IIB [Coprobacillus cateniformis]MCR1889231.1 PTS beta-glucoside transporter subunit IIB [Longibaculum muris]MED9810915.1 PTS beta-glucoside transporter subunit IIB [Longibaculum muris]TCV99626.1 cellobiose-specific phosphotransferase system component IIB [Longibaculum muris]